MQRGRQAPGQEGQEEDPREEGGEAPLSAALDLRAVRKRYGATTALAGVDLRVGAGELVGLLGPNGAGKSTLVKIACGLVRPDGGSVEIDGRPAGARAARARLGYLAELFRFPEWLTADETLALHQRLSGSVGGARERRELLARVALGGVADRRVGTLSKGTQQRLGIAQALIGDPVVVLLDEPVSALDPVGREIVRDLLRDVRDRGAAILLNSHLLTEVERTCDRVVLLRDGAVVREGTMTELLRPTGVTVRTASGVRAVPATAAAEIPALVRRLVAAGEDVLAVEPDVPTIEQVYLEAMRDRADGPPA